MEILYTYSSDPGPLKCFNNGSDLPLEFLERFARLIADNGGYARIVFGATVYAEYGEDPRHR